MVRSVAVLVALAALGGCATQRGVYDWGGYPRSWSAYYLEENTDAGRQAVEQTVVRLQQQGDTARVPPGLYADWGFVLYLRGDTERAVAAFEREAQLFPESAALMQRLVARVRQRAPGPPEAPKPPLGTSRDSKAPVP